MAKPSPLLLFLLLLIGCSPANKKPHFEQVSSDYLTTRKNFKKGKIDTLIRTKNYEFYYAEGAVNDLYFLKKNKKLFVLEPATEMWNEFKNVQIINDSTLFFYTQGSTLAPFGDCWLIKNGSNISIKLDPEKILNSTEYDLIYNNGRLIKIGSLHVNIDSLYLKKLRNKIYRLKDDSLIEVSDFPKTKKIDLLKFNDGVYYFSYPGRYISDTLYLNH
ncbi:MAG TPA: hypothetical protein VHB70_11905 [Parafilimonas sp.]|nr:hypothetical protein [Parafilimonas sp.]